MEEALRTAGRAKYPHIEPAELTAICRRHLGDALANCSNRTSTSRRSRGVEIFQMMMLSIAIASATSCRGGAEIVSARGDPGWGPDGGGWGWGREPALIIPLLSDRKNPSGFDGNGSLPPQNDDLGELERRVDVAPLQLPAKSNLG
jgi:hypothetical protein